MRGGLTCSDHTTALGLCMLISIMQTEKLMGENRGTPSDHINEKRFFLDMSVSPLCRYQPWGFPGHALLFRQRVGVNTPRKVTSFRLSSPFYCSYLTNCLL